MMRRGTLKVSDSQSSNTVVRQFYGFYDSENNNVRMSEEKFKACLMSFCYSA